MGIKIFKGKTASQRANNFAQTKADAGKSPNVFKRTKKWTKKGWTNVNTWVVEW